MSSCMEDFVLLSSTGLITAWSELHVLALFMKWLTAVLAPAPPLHSSPSSHSLPVRPLLLSHCSQHCSLCLSPHWSDLLIESNSPFADVQTIFSSFAITNENLLVSGMYMICPADVWNIFLLLYGLFFFNSRWKINWTADPPASTVAVSIEIQFHY